MVYAKIVSALRFEGGIRLTVLDCVVLLFILCDLRRINKDTKKLNKKYNDQIMISKRHLTNPWYLYNAVINQTKRWWIIKTKKEAHLGLIEQSIILGPTSADSEYTCTVADLDPLFRKYIAQNFSKYQYLPLGWSIKPPFDTSIYHFRPHTPIGGPPFKIMDAPRIRGV